MNLSKKIGKVKIEDLYNYSLIIYIWRAIVIVPLAWESHLLGIVGLLSTVMKMFSIAMLFVAFIYRVTKHFEKKYFAFFIVFIAMLLSWKNTGDDILVWGAAYVLLSDKRAFLKILRLYKKHAAMCLVCIVVSNIWEMTQDIVVNFSYGIGHSYGLGHPNNFAALVMNVWLAWMLDYFLKEKYKKAIIFTPILAYVVWICTVSRTTVLLLGSFWLLIVIYQIMKLIKIEQLLSLLKYSAIAIVLGCIYLMLNYDSSLSGGLLGEHTLVYRFSSAYELFVEYGLKLFGNHIEFVSSLDAIKYNTTAVVLDSGYLNLLINHGVLPCVFFVLGYIHLFLKLNRQKLYPFMIVVFVFLVAGISERTVFMIRYNFTILALLSTLPVVDVSHEYSKEVKSEFIRHEQ